MAVVAAPFIVTVLSYAFAAILAAGGVMGESEER